MTDRHNGSEVAGESRDEVLRKLGRNVLLFQEAELELKWLGARRSNSGAPSALVTEFEKKRRVVGSETMGGVVRRAIEAPAEEDEGEVEEFVAEHGVHVSFGMEVGGSDEALEARKGRLEALLAARNELTHHFLERFDLGNGGDCQKAAIYLDRQHDEHRAVVDELVQDRKGLAFLGKLLGAALQHEDLRKVVLHEPVRQRFVELLRGISDGRARPDGWTSLNVAGQELAARDPELMEAVNMRLGHQRFKEAIVATGEFEVREEPTDHGVRLVFRPAPEA